jgi:hypothetical protein
MSSRRGDVPSPVEAAGAARSGPLGFVLCADDYGRSPGIGEAVRALAAAGRLSAVSCMTTTPHWPEEGARLQPLAGRVDVGLHVNLTDGRPLGPMPRLAAGGRLPALEALTRRLLLGLIDVGEIAAECRRQRDRFSAVIGRPPDFVDGHQHVHQLPLIRRAVLDVLAQQPPQHRPWLRVASQTVAEIARHPAATAGKALAISLLGAGFRREAARRGFAANRRFRGIRRFRDEPPFSRLFAGFLDGIEPGTLVMCHPGSGAAAEDDPGHPAALRADEFDFLGSEALPRLLQERRLAIVRFAAL